MKIHLYIVNQPEGLAVFPFRGPGSRSFAEYAFMQDAADKLDEVIFPHEYESVIGEAESDTGFEVKGSNNVRMYLREIEVIK